MPEAVGVLPARRFIFTDDYEPALMMARFTMVFATWTIYLLPLRGIADLTAAAPAASALSDVIDLPVIEVSASVAL